MATYTFGITESGGTDFLMQSFSKNSQADQAEARDGSGDVAAVEFYNERDEVSFEAVIPSGATIPTVGSTITIDSTNYYVTSAQVTKSNTDYTRMSITAMRYTANSLPT